MLDQHNHKIIIVGGGFSGIATLINLVNVFLHNHYSAEIILCEKSANFGGLAYDTHASQPYYLMNVPIKIMEAFPDKSQPCFIPSLLEWLNQNQASLSPSKMLWNASDFCPRYLYGQYLNAILNITNNHVKNTDIKIDIRINTEVVYYQWDKKELIVKIRTSENLFQEFKCQRMVLASGFTGLPVSDPLKSSLTSIPKNIPYIDNIFQQQERFTELTNQLQNNKVKNLFILGMGPTALDILLDFEQVLLQNSDIHVYLYSRNGLLHLPCPTASILIDNLRITLSQFGFQLSEQLEKKLFNFIQQHYDERQEQSPLQLAMQSIRFLIQNTIGPNEKIIWSRLYNQYFKHLEKAVTCVPDSTFRLLAELFRREQLSFIFKPIEQAQFELEKKDELFVGSHLILQYSKQLHKQSFSVITFQKTESSINILYEDKVIDINYILNAAGFSFATFYHSLFGSWEKVSLTEDRQLFHKNEGLLPIFCLGPYCAEQ